jgi:hypothetical protein
VFAVRFIFCALALGGFCVIISPLTKAERLFLCSFSKGGFELSLGFELSRTFDWKNGHLYMDLSYAIYGWYILRRKWLNSSSRVWVIPGFAYPAFWVWVILKLTIAEDLRIPKRTKIWGYLGVNPMFFLSVLRSTRGCLSISGSGKLTGVWGSWVFFAYKNFLKFFHIFCRG